MPSLSSQNSSQSRSIGIAILVLFSGLAGYLFYAQATFVGTHLSDLPSHVGIAMEIGETGSDSYSLLHVLTAGLGEVMKLCWPSTIGDRLAYSYAMVVWLWLAELLALLLVFGYLRQGIKSSVVAALASIAVMVGSMLLTQPSAEAVYIDSLSPNPWHNPTYIFARPFAIVFYLELMRLSKLSPVKLGIAGFLAMWAKPSFLLSCLPAAVVYLGYYFGKGKIDRTVFQRSVFALLPSLLPFAFIFWLVFQSGEQGNAIVVAPGLVWGGYSSNILMSILKGMAFPLAAGLLLLWRKSSRAIKFVWLNALFAGLIYYLFAESGDRLAHANFAWTYCFGLFFLYLQSVYEVSAYSGKAGWRLIVVGIFFSAHLASGLVYFSRLLNGVVYF